MKTWLAKFVAGFIKGHKDGQGKKRLKKLKTELNKEDLTQEDIKKAYNKAKAPYFNVSLKDFNSENPLEGSFELDYNIFFRDEIEKSIAFPESMNTDDRIEYWFTEVCRQMALETYENANETELGMPGTKMSLLENGYVEYK